jgi:hypothetical protein
MRRFQLLAALGISIDSAGSDIAEIDWCRILDQNNNRVTTGALCAIKSATTGVAGRPAGFCSNYTGVTTQSFQWIRSEIHG